VAAEIGRAMDRYKVVVNKSTVPVGTGELVREVITRHQPRAIEFDVVSNPEFLARGIGHRGHPPARPHRHRRARPSRWP
jgi:UDPglucose 6-dehydrogenase